MAFSTRTALTSFTFHLSTAHLWLLGTEAADLKAHHRLTVTGVFEALGASGHRYAATVRAVLTRP